MALGDSLLKHRHDTQGLSKIVKIPLVEIPLVETPLDVMMKRYVGYIVWRRTVGTDVELFSERSSQANQDSSHSHFQQISLLAIPGLKNRLSRLGAGGLLPTGVSRAAIIQVPAQTINRIEPIKHKLKHFLYLSTAQRRILPASRGFIVDGTVVLIDYMYVHTYTQKRISRELSYP